MKRCCKGRKFSANRQETESLTFGAETSAIFKFGLKTIENCHFFSDNKDMFIF